MRILPCSCSCSKKTKYFSRFFHIVLDRLQLLRVVLKTVDIEQLQPGQYLAHQYRAEGAAVMITAPVTSLPSVVVPTSPQRDNLPRQVSISNIEGTVQKDPGPVGTCSLSVTAH